MMNDPTSRQIAYLERLSSDDASMRLGFWPNEISTPLGVATPKADSHLLGITARPFARGDALDLFSGSGIVASWLVGKAERMCCCDLSQNALSYAEANLARSFKAFESKQGDVFPSGTDMQYNIITANPPYSDRSIDTGYSEVCFDPGNIATRKLLANIHRYLSNEGVALVSWANFASFQKFEGWARENEKICANVQSNMIEPPDNSGDAIEYRVYRIELR